MERCGKVSHCIENFLFWISFYYININIIIDFIAGLIARFLLFGIFVISVKISNVDNSFFNKTLQARVGLLSATLLEEITGEVIVS